MHSNLYNFEVKKNIGEVTAIPLTSHPNNPIQMQPTEDKSTKDKKKREYK